jgi:hypothetical protein
VNSVGGCNISVEALGVSTGDRLLLSLDDMAVGNQEAWFLDRNR